eukprot:IDg13707t1
MGCMCGVGIHGIGPTAGVGRGAKSGLGCMRNAEQASHINGVRTSDVNSNGDVVDIGFCVGDSTKVAKNLAHPALKRLGRNWSDSDNSSDDKEDDYQPLVVEVSKQMARKRPPTARQMLPKKRHYVALRTPSTVINADITSSDDI